MDRDRAEKFHPELAIDNFSAIDCDLSFYSFVRSIYSRQIIKDVLDYGAGRNQYVQEFDPSRDSYLIRDLRDLRYKEAKVTAADVSQAVLTHPTSDRQIVFDPNIPLPFGDASFDLIVSDFVVEHVLDPKIVAHELQRVLRPSGWIAIRTPNKYGYLRLAASAIQNAMHNKVLKHVQPNRKQEDTFPTYYRLNSLKDVKAHFSDCQVYSFIDSWEPAYFFGNAWLYRLFLILHKILPRKFGTASVFIMQKRQTG